MGRYLYVIGGADDNGALSSVERARVNADGSLQSFASVPGVGLATARQGHTMAAILNYVYILGGVGGNGAANSVERASIGPDGSLGPFAIVSDVVLTTARQGHASAIVGHHLYIVGGLGTNSQNSVERAVINADGSLGPFTSLPGVALTTSRHGHTMIVAGRYIYVVGGYSGSTILSSVERAIIDGAGSLAPFEAVTRTALAGPRAHHTAEVFGSSMYILGGITGNSSTISVERAPLSEDGSLGLFSVHTDIHLTTARAGHTTTRIGRYLYALGGSDETIHNDSVERAHVVVSDSLDMFSSDPTLSLMSKRSRHMIAVVDNRVYVLAGTTGGIERASINQDGTLTPFTPVSDITLNVFGARPVAVVAGNSLYLVGRGNQFVERTTINSDGSLGGFTLLAEAILTVSRFNFAAVVTGKYLYVIGGIHVPEIGPRRFLSDVERAPLSADGSLGQFTPVPGLTVPRASHAAVVVGENLYVIGGESDSGSLNSVEHARITSDGTLEPFTPAPGALLSRARTGHTTAVDGNHLYVIGGAGGSYLDTIERANISEEGAVGPFSPIPNTLTLARAGHTTAILGKYMYTIGGENGAGALSSIERAVLYAQPR
jgi:hypothetical protein